MEQLNYNALRAKTSNVIEIIMSEMGLTRSEATKLWYNSKTKRKH